MHKWFCWLLVGFLTLGVSLAAEAIVVSYQTTDLVDRRTQSGSMYFGENMLKIVTAASANSASSEMIYRGDRQLVWIVDHIQKSFIQMDRKTMQRMAARLAEVQRQMEERLSRLPPDQRAQAERLLKDQMPGAEPDSVAGELRETGLTREINGYHCNQYQFYLNGRLDSELWVTRGSQLSFSSMSELLRSMGEFYSGLTRNLPGGSQSVDFDFQALSELDGFPIMIRNLQGGKATAETLIQQIRQETVKADFFEVPAGYQPSNPAQGR